MSSVPWPAVGSLAAGAVSLYFIRYLWPVREEPGARFFIGTIACESLWALAYGLALLTFDPGLRRLFELPIWLGINFIGVFFLAFAFEYTGRGHLVRSKTMAGVVLVQVLHTLVVATNSLHHLAWSDYRIEPVLGAATVTYTHQPWLFVNLTGVSLLVAAASFLLFDTFFSYGPLYRGQAAAIALSPVLPGVAFLLWLFEVGGSPLNLTPLTFPLHLGFDMYAFFRRNMFDMTPAARRAGERTAIEDLGSAIVVVDDDRRIVTVNAEARRLFGADEGEMPGRPLGAFLDADPGDGTVSITTAGQRREYAVSTSPLSDAGGNAVGETIVLQDITAEKQREQRLAVLNRVLRHNLRNDLNVVRGTVGMAEERATDPEVRELLQTAGSKTEEVVELGEKARAVERVLDGGDSEPRAVAVRELIERVRDDLPGGDAVELRVPAELRVRAEPQLLERVFESLLENAVEHGGQRVEVVGRGGDGQSATVEIRDDGPGIPDHERRAIETGEETALEHGSGLGLWLAKWGVESVGGEIGFESDGTGTTVTLLLPAAGGEPREPPP